MNEKAPTRGQRLDQSSGELQSTTTDLPKSKAATKPPSKIKRVMEALTRRSYNRFEAEKLLSDHTIPSTTSTIQNKYGIPVAREWETVPGYFGIPTRVCRYWIAPEHVEQAMQTANFLLR